MNNLVERLRAFEPLMGTIVSLDNPAIAEIIGDADFDWVFIDAEHGALPINALENLVRASAKPSLIRIADRSELAIKQALEIGSAGIIVPQVNDAQTAAEVVAYAKYPPIGTRGVGVGRANRYGMNFSEYLEKANDTTAVVVQIEHIDAVTNARAIIATEGVDAALIGPNDLAASMGLRGQTEHPEVIAAIGQVADHSKALGKPIGIFHGDVNRALAYAKSGFTLIACGVDSILFGQAAHALANQLATGRT